MKIQIENLKKSFGEKVAVDIEQYEIMWRDWSSDVCSSDLLARNRA